MRTQKRLSLLLLSGLLLGSVRATAEPDRGNLLWREDFGRYAVGSKPARYGVGRGEVLADADGRKFFRVSGGVMGGFDYFGAKQWRDYDLAFKLRFADKFHLYLSVKSWGRRYGSNYDWYYLRFSPDAIAPNAHNLQEGATDPTERVKIEPPLACDLWHEVLVGVTLSNVTVTVSSPGEEAPQLLFDQAVLPGTGGIDFRFTGGVVDLADMAVYER